MRHFHEKLSSEHDIHLSYTWVKQALQGAGLRLRGISTIDAANHFLREQYLSDFNQRFMVKTAERGSAFVPRSRKDLDLIFLAAA